MSKQQVTYDGIEMVKKRVSLGLGNWSGIFISAHHKEAIKCPLTLVCYSSCFWWKDGRCIFPREDTPRTKDIKENNGWLASTAAAGSIPGNKRGW